MRSRFMTLALSALLIAGTTAGGIAAKGGASNASSAKSQYHGVGNTHVCPPNSPAGRAGVPGPPCGNGNPNLGGNPKGGGGGGNNGGGSTCHGNSCNAPGHNKPHGHH